MKRKTTKQPAHQHIVQHQDIEQSHQHQHQHQHHVVRASHGAKLELMRVEYMKNGKRYVHDFTGLPPLILTIQDATRKPLRNYALLDLHDAVFDGVEFVD